MKTLPKARQRAPLARHRTRRQRDAKRCGVVMTEFILVFPVLLISIAGILELGRAVMVQQILTNASREGARRAVVPEATNEAVTTLVDNYLTRTSLRTAESGVQILDSTGQAIDDLTSVDPKSVVTLRVTVPYNEVGFGLYHYFSGSTMAAEVQMRKE